MKHKKLYSEIVSILSNCSSDTKNKVGAILLKNERIISTGYNGQPSGLPHTKIEIDNHDISTIHAEMNCLLFAAKEGISTNDCILFSSHFPCVHCTKHLYMAGIKKVFYINDYKTDENPFKYLIEMEQLK